MFFLRGGIIMVLAGMVYQDFRYRGIYWWLFPVLLLLFLSEALLASQFMAAVNAAGSSILFLIVQMLLLSGYISLRQGRLTNIFKGYLGLGDLLFLVCIAFGFSFLNYIFFYLSSLLVAIVLTFVFREKAGTGSKKIPLAGYQAFLLILLLTAGYFTGSIDLHSDTILLKLMHDGN